MRTSTPAEWITSTLPHGITSMSHLLLFVGQLITARRAVSNRRRHWHISNDLARHRGQHQVQLLIILGNVSGFMKSLRANLRIFYGFKSHQWTGDTQNVKIFWSFKLCNFFFVISKENLSNRYNVKFKNACSGLAKAFSFSNA